MIWIAVTNARDQRSHVSESVMRKSIQVIGNIPTTMPNGKRTPPHMEDFEGCWGCLSSILQAGWLYGTTDDNDTLH